METKPIGTRRPIAGRGGGYQKWMKYVALFVKNCLRAHKLSLRHSVADKFETSSRRLEFSQNLSYLTLTFHHTAPVLMNSLPVELRAKADNTYCFALYTPQFPNQLTAYLLHHSFPP